MIEIFLCLVCEILLILGINYYYDEPRFSNPSPIIILFRVSLIGCLVLVSGYFFFLVFTFFITAVSQ